FGRTGAYIVAATGLFVALILSTQFSFSALIKGTGGRLGERVRALRTAFTHYRESRRKEQMRREVIRKHAAAREAPAGLPRIRRVKATDGEETEAEAPARDEDESDDDLPLQAATIAARPAQRPLPFAGAPDDAEPDVSPTETQPLRPRKRRALQDYASP